MMIKLQVRDQLPFITVTVSYNGKIVDIPNVLVDTGSAGTIFDADIAASVGIFPSEQDMPRNICGVGGTEVVYGRRIDYIKAGECRISDFEIEIGCMDYGFEINGIIGMDFLTLAEAVINLKEMIIRFKSIS